MSQKSEIRVELSEMPAGEFVAYALREKVAPPSLGSVKARQRHAQRRLGWSASRVKDAWYSDPRIAIRADEIRQIEKASGLRYGKQELQTVEAYIDRASALLEGQDPDFHRPFVAAIRAFFSSLDRSRTPGGGE